MATVFRIGRTRVEIISNEHRPSHVHVTGPDAWAIFYLNCPDGPVVLRENGGFRLAELRVCAAAIELMLKRCCAVWRRIHGDF
jgi:hypothetical protein